MKVLALDVGGTAIKSAIIQGGKVTFAQQCPSEGKRGGEYVLQNIKNTINSYDDYDVIGISTTGQVNSQEGYIIYANDNVPGYTGMKLASIITDENKKPVFIENDVNAAAIGEGFYGAGKNESDFLCLTYGTGIGGAIIINNEVYRGSNGCAGEVGHIITHPGGTDCNCGLQGCYENYASTTALVKKAITLDPSANNGKIIFDRLEKEDLQMQELVNSWIDEIILGLVNLIHIFNPPCIILGGGILEQPYILQSIQEKLPSQIMSSFRDIKIVSAALGNHAGLFGMAAIAHKRVDIK